MRHTSSARLLAGSTALVGLAAAAAASRPQAISGSVRADVSDPKAMIAQLQAAFTEFKEANDQKLAAKADVVLDEKVGRIDAAVSNFQAALDEMNLRMAARHDDTAKPPVDAEYSGLWSSYIRDGEREAEIKAKNKTGPRAAMSEGSTADGGYTTPIEWDRTITGRLKLITPMRQEAKVQSTSKAGFTKLFTDRSVGSGWVGETAARPATSTPQFTALSFSIGEIYANAAATQDLLDDSEINIEEWLTGEIDTEFSRQEGIAYLSGNGTNKPDGLLTYITGAANAAKHPWGAILTTASGGAGVITTDAVVDMVHALPAIYTPNAKFFTNRLSIGKIRKLKDGQGNYIWQPSFQVGQPSSLMGAPVVDFPDMPAATTGNPALLFGDMRETYLIIDRIGVRVLRDPYTNKPYVCFYVTKRVGGGVQNPDAMKAMVIA